MDELNSGKKTKEVATDLHISKSSVRRCAKKAKAEGGAAARAARPLRAARWRSRQRVAVRWLVPRRLRRWRVRLLTETGGNESDPADVPDRIGGSFGLQPRYPREEVPPRCGRR